MLAQLRRPDYRVEIFDIRSTSAEITPTRINDVVLFNLGLGLLPAIVGPLDFTEQTDRIQVTEVAGDYASQGIASSTLQLTIADPRGFFDPVGNPPTVPLPEALGRWLRQGNVIVVREGDLASPDPAGWPITFTGAIQGQPGQDFNRTTQQSALTAKASSREVDFLRRKNTTRPFAQGVTLESVANAIAEEDMGLDVDEINWPTFGGQLTPFRVLQFVQESALTSIAKIMFNEGFMPRFEGDGRLGLTTGSIAKAPTRTYGESEILIQVTRPILEFNGTNEVEILGLDSNLTKILQARQELARARITTGFFSRDINIPVRWSEDKTQQAQGIEFIVLNSVGASPIAFGSEAFAEFVQSDGGSVEGEIDVDGSLAAGAGLFVLLVGALIGTIFIPDVAPPTGGPVAPVGRSPQTFVLQAAQLILGQTGKGEYRIFGQPYEYVFKELRGVCRVSGIRSEDRQQISIENHLINTQADVDAIADRVLRRERKKQNLRAVQMLHDLRLEPDDVFEQGTGINARRYMIQSISRVLSREGGGGLATLNVFEVTAGVRP